MPLLVLVLFSLVAALVVGLLARRYPQLEPGPPRTTRLARRIDPEAATGLALTLALVLLAGGGVVLGVLTFVLRSDPDAISLDASAAGWGSRHATPFTMDVIDTISHVGEPGTIVALAVVFAIVETIRLRSPWVVPFLLLVVAGNGVLTTTIKTLSDRVRPTVNPVAETLGPSFPSGHSSWSAAFFAAAALVLAVHRGRSARAAIAGVAAGMAVCIGATRVLLGVHWLSDVVAGLALGWAWFAVCAIAFGGRLLRFGATASAAEGLPVREDERAMAAAPPGR
jgi:membrane-associated phospholipid phosphatase